MSLGKKYVVFCGITSPRRARSKTSSMRVARSRNAPSNSPASTRATRLAEIGGVAEPLVTDEAIDELDVELTRATDDGERGTLPIADRVRVGRRGGGTGARPQQRETPSRRG